MAARACTTDTSNPAQNNDKICTAKFNGVLTATIKRLTAKNDAKVKFIPKSLPVN